MSTENQSQCTEKNPGLSPSAQENNVGEQGNQSAIFLCDGNKTITNTSAAELLKTIVIASQSAGHQQRLANLTNTTQTMENALPHDLQSFKGDPFVQINKTQNGHAQPQQQQNAQFVIQGLQEMNTTQTNFNGISTNLINGLVNSQKSKTAVEGGVHGNTEQNSLYNSSEMPTFESINSHNQQSQDYSIEKNGVLQRLLSGENIGERGLHVSIPSGSITVSSPADYSKSSPTSSANSPYGDSNLSPFGENTEGATYMETDTSGLKDIQKSVNVSDTTTQSSLITHTDNLQLDSMIESNIDNEVKYDMACEWDVTKLDENLDRSKSGKVPRLPQDSDASSALSPSVDNVFRAEVAQQEVPSDFTFQLFGQGESEQTPIGVFPGIVSSNGEVSPSQPSPPLPSTVEQPFKTPQSLPHNVVKQQRERLRRAKEPILSQAFPAKIHGYELRILQQPEEQHRARYLTEGSRGSVKNRGGSAYPQVKLFGHSGEATLQIFIGNDSGRVRPHGFYQACKVCGKNSTMCTEKDIDGTTVIEIELTSANDMTASVDCVGILKLRNADVEQRIGIAKAKKKSTKARMIFRVTFQKPCGNPQVLQVASSTILCTQPVGQPEICKMSLKECIITGGEELFIIGKNFLRGTHILFQQASEDDGGVTVWQKEGEIDKDYFQTTHMIVTVPEYTGNSYMGQKIECQVVVNSGGKLSDPQPIFYKPVDPASIVIKQDIMDTVEESRKRNYPFVAPEALELNQQIQQVQQVSSNSDMFQLPPGIISGMPKTNNYTPMEQSTKEGNQADQSTANETLDLGKEENSNFSLDQEAFGQDHNTSNTWNSEQNSVKNNEKNDDLNMDLNNMNFSSMSTEEFNQENQLHGNFVGLKSPQLSNEELFTEHIGIHNPPTSKEDSVVSQFLQNISMAMKESDPMFSGNETLVSNMVPEQSNNIQSNINNNNMHGDSQHNQNSERTNEKSQNIEHSFLKEALTCPPASLQHQNIHTLTNQKSGLFVQKVESGVTDVSSMQVDTSNSEQGLKLEEVMDFNLTGAGSRNTSAVPFESANGSLTFTEANTAVTHSPSINSQTEQVDMPFSPSHVFSSWNKSPTLSKDTKPVFCVVQGGLTNSGQGTIQSVPELKNTFTHESTSHQKTIMSSMVQNQSKIPDLQQAEPGSLEHHLQHIGNTTLTQQLKSPALNEAPSLNETNSINAVLQQMLSNTGIAKQDLQHLAIGKAPAQQQQFVTPTPPSIQQQQFQQQTDNGNNLQQQQQQMFSNNHLQQPQLFQQPTQDQALTNQQQHYQPTQIQQQQEHAANQQQQPMEQQQQSHTAVQQQQPMEQQQTHAVQQQQQPMAVQQQQQHMEQQQGHAVQQQQQTMAVQQQQQHMEQQQGHAVHQQQQNLPVQQQQQQQPMEQQQGHTVQQQNNVIESQIMEQQQCQTVQNQNNAAIQQQAQEHQAIQEQFFQHAQQQQQSVPTPENPINVASPNQTVPGQTSMSTPVTNPSQNPVAPQIIICNNPSVGNQIPQTQFGSPSIVIVPGQSGPNNQVENLLRSILGSMMQPQQQQQQQQQQQSPQDNPQQAAP